MIRKPDKDTEGGVDRSAAVSLERRIRMLRTAMGPEIAAALEDPEVVEVLLNPDGTLWLDRLGSGRSPTGTTLPPAVAERIIRLVLPAHLCPQPPRVRRSRHRRRVRRPVRTGRLP